MNSAKVILNYPKEIETTVFAKLEKESSVKIVGILNWDNHTPDRFEQFAEAKIFPAWDVLHSGILGQFDSVDLRLLTPEILEALRWSEAITLDMMNRIDSNKNMTYSQRVNLYQYLVCYWLGLLNELKPDVLYSRYAPHEVIDFVLFSVCKYLDIKVILFNYTVLPNQLVVADHYKHPWNVLAYDPQNRHSTTKSNWSDTQINNYILSLKGLYQNAIPADSAEAFDINSQAKNSIKFKLLNILLEVRRKVGIVLYGLMFIATAFRSWPSSKSVLTKLIINIQNKIVREDFKSLASYYDKIAHPLELNCHYVYFPLNYQPELTSNPLGGIFTDQILAISLIAKNLPDGWMIYVKEHPAQFLHINFIGQLSRDENFYNKILSIPNVKLVPRNIDQFALIDQSQCIATVTGTTGWQAVVRGKKAIVFGEAWYQNAPNVHRVTHDENCRNAINAILTDPEHSDDDVIKYLHDFINKSVEIVFDETGAKYTNQQFDLSYSTNRLYEILTMALNNSLISNSSTD